MSVPALAAGRGLLVEESVVPDERRVPYNRDHVVLLVLSAAPGTGEGLSGSSMKE